MPSKPDPDMIGGTPRARSRPKHVQPPADWSMDAVPTPQPMTYEDAKDQPGGRDPVRYGDWENKGLAIDF